MMMVLSLPSLRAKENNNNASRRFKIHRPANNHLATPHLDLEETRLAFVMSPASHFFFVENRKTVVLYGTYRKKIRSPDRKIPRLFSDIRQS
jgi:hypothetical protein